MTAEAPIGVIGGTGLYALGNLLDNVHEIEIDTPFGKPSGKLTRGVLRGSDRHVVFLARHGVGHVFTPTEVPYAANIWALKSIGVRIVISLSAVGSLKEEHAPTDMLLVRQFIDRTKGTRTSTFFGNGCVAHVSFADPVCNELGDVLYKVGKDLGLNIKLGGTYVCMEGPAFSTRAESNLYRSWGADVIGMTNLTEAKLAREAEIAYATIALATDYDCWRVGEEHVTVEVVGRNMAKNAENSIRLVEKAIRAIDPKADWPAHHALDCAICTDHRFIPEAAIKRLGPVASRLFTKK